MAFTERLRPDQVNEHGQATDEKVLKKNRLNFSLGIFLHPGVWFGLGWGIPTRIIRAFGGTDQHIGFLGSANAGAASLFQFLGTFVLRRTGSNRKAMVAVLVAAMIIIGLTAGSVLGIRPHAGTNPMLYLFLACLVLGAAVLSTVQNIESAWIGDLVPKNRLGWFTSLKWIALNVAAFVFGVAIAKFADAHSTPRGYALVYVFVVLAILAALLVYSRATDREPRSLKFTGVGAEKEHLNYRSRALWCYVSFYVLWAIGRTLWVTFSSIFLMEQFKFSFTKLAWLNNLQLVVSCIVIYLLGKLSDVKGNRILLIFVSGFIAICMYLWVSSAWLGLAPIVVYTILNGAAGQTHSMLAINLGLEIFPDKGRSAYLAFSRLFIGITAFLAPLIAGSVMTLFKDIQVNIHGASLTRYHLVFFIASSITLTCIVPLILMGKRRVE